jgi:hypothetical protein
VGSCQAFVNKKQQKNFDFLGPWALAAQTTVARHD